MLHDLRKDHEIEELVLPRERFALDVDDLDGGLDDRLVLRRNAPQLVALVQQRVAEEVRVATDIEDLEIAAGGNTGDPVERELVTSPVVVEVRVLVRGSDP